MNTLCESCQYKIFDSIGTQLYCAICDRTNLNFDIQEEIVFVPAEYLSNHKTKKQLELERTINHYIRQFSDKYRDIHNSEQIGILRSKVLRIKQNNKYSKGTRELVAAVVFCQLSDYICQMNIRQFCKLNNVSMRRFHSKYKMYHKVYLREGKEQAAAEQLKREVKKSECFQQQIIKVQQKIEESQQNQNNHYYQNENMLIEEQNDGYLLNFHDVHQSSEDYSIIDQQQQDIIISSSHYQSSILAIYDQIFSNYYLQSKKKYVVQKLINKLKQIDYSALAQIRKQEPDQCFRAYYLIYAVLKALGNKIFFGKYSQIVKDNTGYTLRAKTSHDIQQLLQSQPKVDQNSSQGMSSSEGSIKIEQKYSQINQMNVPFQFMNVSLFYNEDQFFI